MNCGKLIMMSSSASTGSSLTGSPLSIGGSELPEGSDGSPHAASARSMQSARINAKYFFIVYPPFHFSHFYQLLIKGYTIFVQIALAAIDLFYCLFLTQRVFLPASYQNIA